MSQNPHPFRSSALCLLYRDPWQGPVSPLLPCNKLPQNKLVSNKSPFILFTILQIRHLAAQLGSYPCSLPWGCGQVSAWAAGSWWLPWPGHPRSSIHMGGGRWWPLAAPSAGTVAQTAHAWPLQHGGLCVLGILIWWPVSPKKSFQRTRWRLHDLLWPSLGHHAVFPPLLSTGGHKVTRFKGRGQHYRGRSRVRAPGHETRWWPSLQIVFCLRLQESQLRISNV